MIGKLIAHQVKLWWVFGTRGRRKGAGGRVLASLIGLAIFVVFAHFGAHGFFNMVEGYQAGRASHYLPVLFAIGSAVGLIPIMGIALSELYLRSDLDLLLSSPLKIGALFATKLAGLVMATVGIVGVLFLSILSGYARAIDASATFYFGAVFLVAIVSLFLSTVDMSLVMLVARLMPAKRVQGLVLALTAIVGAVFWVTFQVITRGMGPATGPPGTPAEFLFPAPPQLRALITSYPARALHAIQSSNGITFMFETAVFLVLTLGLVLIAYWIFRATFYEGNARVRTAPARPSLSPSRLRLREQMAQILPDPIRGLVIKDWLSFPRDLRYLSALIFPAVMVFFFALRGFSPTGVPANIWMSVAPVGLLSLLLASGTAMPSIGMEGKNFSLLRSLPVSVDQILVGKFAAFYPIVLVVTWVALVAIAVWRGIAPGLLVMLLAGSAWLAAGATALAVGLGALGANFEAETPQKAVSPGTSIVALVVGMLFFITNGGLLYWITEGPRSQAPYWPIFLTGIAAALVTIGLIGVLVLAGRRHLHRVEI